MSNQQKLKRNKTNGRQVNVRQEQLVQLTRLVGEVISRQDLAYRLGFQYGDYRKLYKSLGYPEEQHLRFQYYFNKYDRLDVAQAVIDRPVEATWNGELKILEPDTLEQDSELLQAWQELDQRLKIKQVLKKVDKLSGIGRYAVLVFGFSDVTNREQLKTQVGGRNLKLLYLQRYSEKAATIDKVEENTRNPRFGKPLSYKIVTENDEVEVHHSRILHVTEGSLVDDVYGTPKLKPIVNRLEDIEKILGGDAEMFWRGARPGYHVKPQEGFQLGDDAISDMEDELDKYEHDLRRMLTTTGIEDIKALAQQIADPEKHYDVQMRAIATQTGIPKRILEGSERGELASSQDLTQWLDKIKTRMEEYAEPFILRPVIDKLMEHGILPNVKGYNVMWEDLFAPSEKDKAEVGQLRASSLKEYSTHPFASEILPPEVAFKLILGLNQEQVEEAMQAMDDQAAEEDRMMRDIEEEEDQPLRRG